MESFPIFYAAVLSLFLIPGRAPGPIEAWAVSGLQASYIYDDNRCASIDFTLVVPNGRPLTRCSISIPQLAAFMLPNITDTPCDEAGRFALDLTLYPPFPGAVSGANFDSV
ncbi:hypothetical protein TruAng_012190 [Truncatella angustata]|nr:hypothetical protein TruAng_012190 [Truncatella angustata]